MIQHRTMNSADSAAVIALLDAWPRKLLIADENMFHKPCCACSVRCWTFIPPSSIFSGQLHCCAGVQSSSRNQKALLEHASISFSARVMAKRKFLCSLLDAARAMIYQTCVWRRGGFLSKSYRMFDYCFLLSLPFLQSWSRSKWTRKHLFYTPCHQQRRLLCRGGSSQSYYFCSLQSPSHHRLPPP
jgi:hypothetical protein